MPTSKKMRGAGSWDEYCYCCGLPFSFGYDSENIYLSSGKPNASALHTILEKGEQVGKSIQWITNNIGLDSSNNLLFELGRGSDMGNMLIKKQQPYPGAQEIYDNGAHIFVTGELANMEDGPRGLAIHKDCATVLEEALGRSLKPSDELALRRFQKPGNNRRNDGSCFHPYNQQFYEWADALYKEPVAFFASPLSNTTQRNRILQCNSAFLSSAKSGKKTRRSSLRKSNTRRRRL